MENKNIELEIACTGEVFFCENVPLSLTIGQLLNEFLSSQNFNQKLGASWHLALDSRIIDKDLKLSEIIYDDKEITKFMLIMNVVAG